MLKAMFVQGRLTKDEFDARIGQALAARTYADLAAVIPAGLIGAQSPQKAARTPVNSGVKSSVCAIALAAALWLAAFLTDNAAVFMVAIVVTVSVFLTSPAADALMLGSRQRRRNQREDAGPAGRRPATRRSDSAMAGER